MINSNKPVSPRSSITIPFLLAFILVVMSLSAYGGSELSFTLSPDSTIVAEGNSRQIRVNLSGSEDLETLLGVDSLSSLSEDALSLLSYTLHDPSRDSTELTNANGVILASVNSESTYSLKRSGGFCDDETPGLNFCITDATSDIPPKICLEIFVTAQGADDDDFKDYKCVEIEVVKPLYKLTGKRGDYLYEWDDAFINTIIPDTKGIMNHNVYVTSNNTQSFYSFGPQNIRVRIGASPVMIPGFMVFSRNLYNQTDSQVDANMDFDPDRFRTGTMDYNLRWIAYPQGATFFNLYNFNGDGEFDGPVNDPAEHRYARVDRVCTTDFDTNELVKRLFGDNLCIPEFTTQDALDVFSPEHTPLPSYVGAESYRVNIDAIRGGGETGSFFTFSADGFNPERSRKNLLEEFVNDGSIRFSPKAIFTPAAGDETVIGIGKNEAGLTEINATYSHYGISPACGIVVYEKNQEQLLLRYQTSHDEEDLVTDTSNDTKKVSVHVPINLNSDSCPIVKEHVVRLEGCSQSGSENFIQSDILYEFNHRIVIEDKIRGCGKDYELKTVTEQEIKSEVNHCDNKPMLADPATRFSKFPDKSTFVDQETGLEWSQCVIFSEGNSNCNDVPSPVLQAAVRPEGDKNLGFDRAVASAVLAAARRTGFRGYTDWKLPTEKELYSLYEHGCGRVAIPVDTGFGQIGNVYAHDPLNARLQSFSFDPSDKRRIIMGDDAANNHHLPSTLFLFRPAGP